MTSSRLLRGAICLVLAVPVLSCAGGRRFHPDSEPAGAQMGVYRARLQQGQGESHRFRLLLYATLPDRIHGEILSPLGTIELIFDGGGGRVAVTIPREGVSYAGAGDSEAMGKVLGVPLSLEQLVQGLLGQSTTGTDYVLARKPEGRAGLPDTMEISGRGNRLSLKLKKLQPLRVSTASLGNGEPPPGMELRPLDSLEAVELPRDPDGGEG